MVNAKNEPAENDREAAAKNATEDTVEAEGAGLGDLDAAAERLVASLSAIPLRRSAPNLEELDLGWEKDGDDDAEDDDDDDDDDDAEDLKIGASSVRDERQDSAAFAAAKESRALRATAHRLSKHAKAAAKQAQRNVRIDAQKQMQKRKQKKARAAPQGSSRAPASAAPSKRSARVGADRTASSTPGSAATNAYDAGLSKTNQWMLAGAIILFLAAAAFAAAVSR